MLDTIRRDMEELGDLAVGPGNVALGRAFLEIPSKRFERGLVELLVDEEIDALLDAPDTSTWIGRRDRALLLVAVQTGLRVSELTALRRKDLR